MGWRKEEGQAEANRVRTVKQLKKKLKIQPGGKGSWRWKEGWRRNEDRFIQEVQGGPLHQLD